MHSNSNGLKFARLFIKCAVLLILIATLIQLKPNIVQDVKQTATATMARIKLPFEPAPTANSLPNPLIDAHLTDTWGAARSGGRKHEGIDIFADRGTPIHATTKGIVRKVGLDELGGNVVIIRGPGSTSHYYAHLENFADIKKGNWVNQGDIIGYVGNSGNAKTTPPHLHYGVYQANGAVNPYPLLQK